MGLVWDHLKETKAESATKGWVRGEKRGFYLANELSHRDVKRRVFRESHCPLCSALIDCKVGAARVVHCTAFVRMLIISRTVRFQGQIAPEEGRSVTGQLFDQAFER